MTSGYADAFAKKHGLDEAARSDLLSLFHNVVGKTRKKITVRVPATSANLGPGFDCCGLALDIWNEVTVERSAEFGLEIEGEGAAFLPRDASNLVCVGLEAAFKTIGKPVPTLKYYCINRVPFARGLGSSSAGIVSGLLAGLAIANYQLRAGKEEELLQMAANIEGHPDNVAPCIYGGFQLGIHDGSQWASFRVTVPHGLMCVIFCPDHITETKTARAVLPDSIDQKDAVFNCARVALLVSSFATNHLEGLRSATEDVLHQPYRAGIHPHLVPLVRAALDAGAHGAHLSGAGPAVLAYTSGRRGDVLAQNSAERREKEVAQAMLSAAESINCPGRVVIARPVEVGGHVVAEGSDLGKELGDPRIVYFQ